MASLSTFFLQRSALASLLLVGMIWGNAAIITLEMPVGARQTGMGEAGAALADDANAPYYNPAGLAFGPLAHEWTLSRPQSGVESNSAILSLTGRKRSGFLSRPDVWAGTVSGLQHFNGREWRDFHSEILEGNARILDLVRTFAGTETGLDSLVEKVRVFNGIKSLAEESFLVEVRLPWNLVVNDSVTALHYEERTQKLWVGTPRGLYRFDGKGWKSFALELGALRITTLISQGATLWIGTSDGLFSYRNGVFEQKGKVLPSQHMVALAWSELRGELFVAVRGAGVARLVPKRDEQSRDRWSLFGLEDGLMDLEPVALSVDSSGHVWVGHGEGVSYFNLRKWEQIRFEKNRLHSLAVAPDGAVWMGTEKGVWRHRPLYSTAKGRKVEVERKGEEDAGGSGEWTHFHTGNGLRSNMVQRIHPQGDDIWFGTLAGIERYVHAPSQLAFFYEKLLPVLNIPDLYHLYTGVTFPMAEWGTLALWINFISFGQTVVSGGDFDQGAANTFNSTETVVGLGYGTRLNRNWGLGLNFKFFYSSLSAGAIPGEPDAKTASYAVDLGILGKDIALQGLNLALVLANVGPNVYYVDKSNDDPIPLTWRVGFAYTLLEQVDHRLVLVGDYNRLMVYRDDYGRAQPFYISSWKSFVYPRRREDGDGMGSVARKSLLEGVFNGGMEYTYSNTLALRAGMLYDQIGQRWEANLGLGVLLSDLLQLDIANIVGLGKTEGVRDGQLRFSLLFKF